jgi:flagellar biosynthesis anti-sigma factor FlgM
MNVNNSPLSSTGAADIYKSDLQKSGDVQETRPAARAAAAGASVGSNNLSGNDDVHLSELVRSLRSLAADSPERQARIEQLARASANGTYKVDAHATADAVIQDAITPR